MDGHRELAIMAIKARVERATREALRPRETLPVETREEMIEDITRALTAAAAALIVFGDCETLPDGSLKFSVSIPGDVARHLGLCICNPQRPNLGEHLPNCPAREPGNLFPLPASALAHWGDPCRYCGKAHDEVEPGPCPERLGRSCTCDEAGDGPCPVHGPEMAEQDERIGRRNFEYLAHGGACPLCGATGMDYAKAEGKLRCSACGAEYCPRCAGVMNLDLEERDAGLRCKCPAPRPGNEDGHFTDFPA